MGIEGLSSAAKLVLLKGPRGQGGEAMKLAILELIAAGDLDVGRDEGETTLTVSSSARSPANRTHDSMLAAVLSVEAEGPPIPFAIALEAKTVKGNLSASSIDGWLARYPLTELYDARLMATRRRLLRRDSAELTDAGRVARSELEQRIGDGTIEEALGLRVAIERWPDSSRFVKRLGTQGVGDGGAGNSGPLF